MIRAFWSFQKFDADKKLHESISFLVMVGSVST